MISYTIAILFKIIYIIIVFEVLLSWVPIFDNRKEPFATVERLYNTLVAPFKAIIPPIGGLDFSPFVAILFYSFADKILVSAFSRIGL